MSAFEFDVVVEVPAGSRNKYEMDHKTGRIYLDRKLFTATRYPADYGYVPDTLSEGSDPLDVLVIVDEPTFPGCYIHCRPLGVLWMEDEHGRDAKILAVPVWDHVRDWKELEDVPATLREEIRHFFEVYKALEPGKSSAVEHWESREMAEREILISRERYNQQAPH